MKDYKRAARREAAKTKYVKRLTLHLTVWNEIHENYNAKTPTNNATVLRRPIPALVIGTIFEKYFYRLKSSSCPCSCSMCRAEKYVRDKNEYRNEILKELEYESCCDRLPRIL